MHGDGAVCTESIRLVRLRRRIPRPGRCTLHLLFISRERISILTEPCVQGPPDSVDEAISPGTAKRDRSRDLSLGGGYSVTGPAAASGNVNGSVRSRNTGESTERGQTTRHDRLTSEITVRVVGIEPNGVLRVEGTKRMVIDEHEQEITLSGLLRPEDVPANNVVESWRIADAVISYDSNGKLGSPKGSVLGRILGWLWP